MYVIRITVPEHLKRYLELSSMVVPFLEAPFYDSSAAPYPQRLLTNLPWSVYRAIRGSRRPAALQWAPSIQGGCPYLLLLFTGFASLLATHMCPTAYIDIHNVSQWNPPEIRDLS